MRKVLLLALSFLFASAGFSQLSKADEAAAIQLVRSNVSQLGLPDNNADEVKISSSYAVSETNMRMVYLQQTFQGIPVYNSMKTLAFRDGKVISNMGNMELSMGKRSAFASSIPSISSVTAVDYALVEAGTKALEPVVPINITENGKKMQFGRLGASTETISAELLWIPNERNEYKLAWQVFVAPIKSSDYWLIRVDAQSGKIINKQNLTVTCNWDGKKHSVAEHIKDNHQKKSGGAAKFFDNYVIAKNEAKNKWEYRPFAVSTATYKVVKYPAESPNHTTPVNTVSDHTDPWLMTPGNATSLGWHSDGPAPANDYNITRGNNVWAQEDRDNNNTTFGITGNSTTALPNLTFPVAYDFAQGPLAGSNQQAAIVNLFYINNLMHDMAYRYGFDEVAGNFQNDNQSRGGAGVDYVIADAQDAGGTNNANFATPADGTRPRMQMYLWTTVTPNRDGDLDNGIVAHEYGHGISNRFTGGPSNVSCLGNAEQGGEGWSDYMSLMMGTNWATATVNDGTIARGIGTYALNQPVTGTGIREFPYSTNIAVFPFTYANLPGRVVPHGVGSVWCGMIWEMTWEIIRQDNFIEPNFLNPSGAVSTWRGNAAAMKLVMEGMRLQPCQPGFVDARNAILTADANIFGGRYNCAIWKAFAKRGLGRNASQGASTSATDGVADFTVDAGAFAFAPNVATAPEASTITYTNNVTTGLCTPMTNYVLRDTLPLSVTYVSNTGGGTYIPATRVVEFPVNLPINSNATFTTTVTVNNGTYFAPVTHLNDPVTAIAPNWTASSTTANVWQVSATSVRSAPSAFLTPDAAVSSQQILTLATQIPLPSGPAAFSSLSFWHRFSTEATFDGGVVEISTNNGATWADAGQYMTGLRYTGVLSTDNTFLGGRNAFQGNSGATFQQTTVNLAAFAGQNILVRFRFASDPSVGGTGWFIDDILISSAPFVYTKSGLYDNVNVRLNYKDSLTPITQAICPDPPAVTAPTLTQPTCGGSLTGTIVVNATGVEAMEYSINGGSSFQGSNTFTGLAAGNYNIVVRYIARPGCSTPYASNPVVINALTGTPTITAPTVTQPLCPVLTGTIVVNATGTGTLEYSVNGAAGPWQTSNTFAGLAPNSYNIAVREQATPGCFSLYGSNPIVINPVVGPVIVTNPVNRVICQNGNTTFSIVDNNPIPAPTYQWQISTSGAGGPWTNLANVAPFAGVTTSTLTLTNTGVLYNGNFFRCVVTNVCGPVNSNSASLTVNPLPIVNAGPNGLCAPVTLTASGTAGTTYAWTPAAGLNTTTGPTVIATPTATTVYTVTGTITATGCQNSASITVLGTPATPVITPAAPVICAGVIQPLTVAPSTMSVTYSGSSLLIPGTGTGAGTGAPASVYPAVINVTGLPTSGARVKSVTLNGLSHSFPSDVDALVQSPTGTNVVVLSDVGGGTDIVNGTVVLDDAAPTAIPAVLTSGTFRPTNPAGTDAFPAPGPGNITQTDLPLSTFTGNLNGNWNLFVVDDAGIDAGSLTSWSITFEVATALWSPAAGLFTDANATTPYVLGTPASTVYFQQSPTTQTQYTYTVTNTLGTCTAATTGSVTVTVNPLPVFTLAPNNQCAPATLTATGNATTYSWSPNYGLSATTGASVTANPPLNTIYTATGTITATGCTSTQTVTVNATPATPVVTPAAVNICEGAITQLSVAPVVATTPNGGTIAIPAGAPTNTAAGPAGPYPAAMVVGGLPTSGVRVKSVQINGISHTFPDDIDMLLQSPTGTNVVLMSDVGLNNALVNNNFVFDDAATATMADGGPIPSGSYKPTNFVTPDTWVAPGPGAVTQATPTLSSFTGNLNGTWNLFIVDDAGLDVGSIASWSITFETTGALWTPAVTLFSNPTATVPYVAGTMASTVYAKPTTSTTYTVNRTNGTCTSGNATSVVTVFNPIVITTQPASQTVCNGANVTFSVAHTGNFPAYQWELSTDNGTTWGPIAGANANSITISNATTAITGRRYRVIITNTCTTVTSAAAILTVNPLPTVVATDLFNQRVCLSDTLVPLVGTPTGGSWSGIGVSGFNFVPSATAVGSYVLTYSFTNTFGCTSTDTTRITVQDCPERIRLLRDDAVILYPNPNNGNFFVRMNSTLYNYLGMDVYTSAGQLVSKKQFHGLVYGRVIPINLTHLPVGIYMVKFFYDDGVRTSEKTFKVIIGRQ
jgi:subtilisin-like proprotein convertase family protein